MKRFYTLLLLLLSVSSIPLYSGTIDIEKQTISKVVTWKGIKLMLSKHIALCEKNGEHVGNSVIKLVGGEEKFRNLLDTLIGQKSFEGGRFGDLLFESLDNRRFCYSLCKHEGLKEIVQEFEGEERRRLFQNLQDCPYIEVEDMGAKRDRLERIGFLHEKYEDDKVEWIRKKEIALQKKLNCMRRCCFCR